MAKNNKDFFAKKNSWSIIKDRLLGCYLPQYFQKVLTTGSPIYYVDCFAGKGKFDDGSFGSPIIALQIRNERLNSSTYENARIDTCFIDKNYSADLKVNLIDFCDENGSLQIVSGRYEDEIEKLLDNRKSYNVFLYIDPYGIKALDAEMFKKFATHGFRSIEMLINMNSFGFFRDACRAMKVDYKNDEALNSLEDIVEYDPTQIDTSQQSENLLSKIAGGDYWKDIVNDFNDKKLNGYEAEKRFSSEYKRHLQQSFTYVLDMPIRLKPGHQPKYRMIHVSNHEHGCILMADNMASRSDELFIDIQQNGQLNLFDYNVENEVTCESDISKKLLDILSDFPKGLGVNKLLANFYTEYGVLCKSGMIKKNLKEMENKNIIKVIRNPALTDGNRPSRTFTESKTQSVIIRGDQNEFSERIY